MSERPKTRRPIAFRLDDPEVRVGEGNGDAGRARHRVIVEPEPEPAALQPVVPVGRTLRRRFPWGALFWSAAGALLSLGLSLAVIRFVEDLFARAEWLGWTGLALSLLAAVALLAVAVREGIGLARLATVEKLKERAARVISTDDRDAARALVGDLLAFTQTVPHYARGRAIVAGHLHDIIDGADLVKLAERELMPLADEEARRLVATAAKRVSVVTAVSPRAAIDMIFVFISALRLIRSLAELYGGRPGTLGLIRLVRLVVAHLAVTGGMAAGDSLVQQMLGHGVAAKLSARLGEGVLNGLLTTRLGLAAIEVARPMPFVALPPPKIADLASGFLRRRADGEQQAPQALSARKEE